MKSLRFLLAAVVFGVTDARRSGDHPVVKVITMLKGLKEKAVTESKAEAVEYAKFEYWCSQNLAEIKGAISDEKQTIEVLGDTISGKEKQEASLEEKIAALKEQIKDHQASALRMKQARKKEYDHFVKSDEDYSATIAGLSDAIKALTGARAATTEFVQESMKKALALVDLKASAQDVETLQAFLAESPDNPYSDKMKNTKKYEFKSLNVVELLKELKRKFEDEKAEALMRESNAAKAFEQVAESRKDAILAAQTSEAEKSTAAAVTQQEVKESASAQKDEKADLEADTDRKVAVLNHCQAKALEWKERSETRRLEIEAMDSATAILAKAAGVRSEAPRNAVLPPSPAPVAFIQLSSSHKRLRLPVMDDKMKAVLLLRKAAKSTHSRSLERFAAQLSAHLGDPFAEMKNMIQKMIFQLMQAQTSEDEHKHWCDKELAKTTKMKDAKDDRIAELSASIKVENAAVTQLTEDMLNIGKMISKITSFVAEATDIRNEGKEENKMAIKDAEDAQTAIANAIAVLRDFYAKSGENKDKEVAQLSDSPSTWDSPYTAVADPAAQPAGIISVLEAVGEDFDKMEGETRAQEQMDQKQYEDAMKANAVEKARRTKEQEMKSAEKTRRIEQIAMLQASMRSTSGELEKTEQYLKDLDSACSSGDSDYESRKANRDKEIAALKRAQETLERVAAAVPSGSFLQARLLR